MSSCCGKGINRPPRKMLRRIKILFPWLHDDSEVSTAREIFIIGSDRAATESDRSMNLVVNGDGIARRCMRSGGIFDAKSVGTMNS